MSKKEDVILVRLEEKFSSLEKHIDFRFGEQDKKNVIMFDFINNKLAKKDDLDSHVKNHNSGLKIGAIVFSIALGLWGIGKDLVNGLIHSSPK